jgi:CD109 antigen
MYVSPFSANGHVTIKTTVPDTITSWVASAFAVNKVSGLGIAPTSAKVCMKIR